MYSQNGLTALSIWASERVRMLFVGIPIGNPSAKASRGFGGRLNTIWGMRSGTSHGLTRSSPVQITLKKRQRTGNKGLQFCM
jgi:hypothetical protein